ncbi:MAG TPA: HEAT repeat domain-containing protein [Ktedonobacteraceae bacterium]|nr:HEAT repeat domain-containing protein [Ktedonobacteraceae bacterium]
MMSTSDSSSQKPRTPAYEAASQEQLQADITPPVGDTPPLVLAREAANGRRGAAWRLLLWIMQNDPRAVVAVSSLDDDRLAENLLGFIASGTWAGKSFVVPVPLRTAHARTRLRTLFLPGSGIEYERAERVLLAHIHDKQPAMRETVAHILGIIGSPSATPLLIEALDDTSLSVRLQAAKALGRVGDPAAVPALLSALRGADEQLGSQIFSSLVRLGSLAVPALIQRSKSSSAWLRWHCIRALGEIHDRRALPILVDALQDADHSVAWMGAKGLAQFGKESLKPLLELLMRAEMTPWLAETASYVLKSYARRNAEAKPMLEPLAEGMRQTGFRIGTAVAAQKALEQLQTAGMLETA